MADSVSTEAWLDQRRWAALEEALKAQGSNVKRHLQDYLITLYNETVPLERWVQIETAITKEELESAQAAEDQKVYAAFHIRENGHDSIFSTGNGEEFLDVAIRLRRYLQGDAEAVKGGFSHHFYKTQPITVTNRMDRAWGKQGPPCCGSRRKKGWRFGCRKRRSVNFIDFPQLLKPLFIGNDEWISLRKCGIVLLHGQPTGA